MERRRKKQHEAHGRGRKKEKWWLEEERRGRHGDAVPPAVASRSLRPVPDAPAEHWSAPW